MKREDSYTVKPVPQRINVITVYVCDICKEDITNKGRYTKYTCDICNRDCHNNWKCGSDHPEDHGDYPRTLCRICLDLYNALMLPLQTEYELAEEQMLERIKRESLIS